MDVVVSFNGKMVAMHDTMKDIGIGHDCTLRYTGWCSEVQATTA